MRGGWRHCRRQDPSDMRPGLQQASLFGPATGYPRPDGMGHRPVSHLQRRLRAFLGSRRQRQRLLAAMGHLRRPREGPEIRLRTLGRRLAVLQHQQSGEYRLPNE